MPVNLFVVNNETGSVTWKRDCIDSTDVIMGCADRLLPNSETIVEACVCDTPLCNEKMGPMPGTTTMEPTTPKPSASTRLITGAIAQLFFLILMIYNVFQFFDQDLLKNI